MKRNAAGQADGDLRFHSQIVGSAIFDLAPKHHDHLVPSVDNVKQLKSMVSFLFDLNDTRVACSD